MTPTDWQTQEPRLATPAGVPARVRPTRPLAGPATLPAAPDAPPWHHSLLPKTIRNFMADLGWWQNPVPQRPSIHLEQTLAVIRRRGWGQSLDVSPTGRVCIRGAQALLERAGHVTPHARERAIAYMQQTLAEAGVVMQFFTWNDLPGQDLATVENLLVRAAYKARANGE